ncbi:MAG: DUF429 domain-containing protein [Dichotomicrobium sp.]
MDVYGADFTSRPTRGKPITCLHCRLEGGVLRAQTLETFPDFDAFEAMLQRPGPWIAGLDFPFGQARKFIETIGWPARWAEYVRHAKGLGRQRFRDALEAYRRDRADGDKEHRRATDIAAGSTSPQKLYGTPVALMFFEGAPRLIRAGVTIPHMLAGASDRIVVETYPGVLARQIVGRRAYKNDASVRQTPALLEARRDILEGLCAGARREQIGFEVAAERHLCDDAGGDQLDALLCAVQAAWAWRNRANRYGAPDPVDPREGWIADPVVTRRASHPETS